MCSVALMSAARQFRPGRGKLTPAEAALRCKECTEEQVDSLFVERHQETLRQHQLAVRPARTGGFAAVALLLFVLIAGGTFLCVQVV